MQPKKWFMMMKHDIQERYYDFMLRRTKEANEQDFYEACMYFYMVKGHLETSNETIIESKDGYFNRLWRDGCDGAPLSDYVDGFEEAYKKRIKHGYNK